MGYELWYFYAANPNPEITVSIGVSAYRSGERPRLVIERADSCLCKAKHEGRNCVCCEVDDASQRRNAARKACAAPIKSARASNHLRRSPFKPWFRGSAGPRSLLISVSLDAGKT